jgi:hypothetical protein
MFTAAFPRRVFGKLALGAALFVFSGDCANADEAAMKRNAINRLKVFISRIAPLVVVIECERSA